MTYYVQKPLKQNPSIEFCDVRSPIHIHFFHEKGEKEGIIL